MTITKHTCCAVCRGEASAPATDMDGCSFACDCGADCEACWDEYTAAHEAALESGDWE